MQILAPREMTFRQAEQKISRRSISAASPTLIFSPHLSTPQRKRLVYARRKFAQKILGRNQVINRIENRRVFANPPRSKTWCCNRFTSSARVLATVVFRVDKAAMVVDNQHAHVKLATLRKNRPADGQFY